MLGKVLALLTQLKAAGATVVIIAGAATVTVAGTSPEVQDTLHQLTNNLGLTQSSDCDNGQPVVVAQRNSADALLRAAHQKDQKALEDLRGGGKNVDGQKLADVLRKADGDLRDALNTSLNAVAAETLGRSGQNRSSASPAATPTASPSGSASPAPSCTPAPSASASPLANASASPKPSGSSKPDQEGRVTVAERTTLDPAIQKIVDDGIAAMAKVVTDATTAVGALPTPDHGKPSDQGKPTDNPGNKPEDKGKPSGTPAHP
jgi:hypothetical protein